MIDVTKQRMVWVQLYLDTHDSGLVCRRCGISRPTLRKWVRRHDEQGLAGLQDQSRRPHRSPNAKVGEQEQSWILDLRKSRKLGARRIQNELHREQGCSLGLATIHKALIRHNVKPLKRHRKIAPGIYQYTAVDDCSRYRVLGVFSRRTAANTLTFLDQVFEEMPFPIQRFQTDRGREFFAVKVQEKMMENGIKFRPNKPGSPHLNGKVERSQKTDKNEFYATVKLDLEELQQTLPEWQHYYNWQRAHGSLKGKTPLEKVCDLLDVTPLQQDVSDAYDQEKERIQLANYQLDLQVRKLKPCL